MDSDQEMVSDTETRLSAKAKGKAVDRRDGTEREQDETLPWCVAHTPFFAARL
jgi:hypothetical protein